MKTNRKRVVITGLGILSSLEENIQDFREALLNKKMALRIANALQNGLKMRVRQKCCMTLSTPI